MGSLFTYVDPFICNLSFVIALMLTNKFKRAIQFQILNLYSIPIDIFKLIADGSRIDFPKVVITNFVCFSGDFIFTDSLQNICYGSLIPLTFELA